MNSRTALVGLFVLGISGLAGANPQRPAPPRATTTEAKPLSSTLRQARTVFLINESGGPATDTEFRQLQAQIRQWNRFLVVDSADRADVTISLRTSQVERVRTAGGVPVGARLANPKTSIVRTNLSTLTVRQRSNGEILWTGEDEAVAAMIQRLQQDMTAPPGLCVVFWCW
jgi:hypothetical protein